MDDLGWYIMANAHYRSPCFTIIIITLNILRFNSDSFLDSTTSPMDDGRQQQVEKSAPSSASQVPWE